jgi:hypothetical protein
LNDKDLLYPVNVSGFGFETKCTVLEHGSSIYNNDIYIAVFEMNMMGGIIVSYLENPSKLI